MNADGNLIPTKGSIPVIDLAPSYQDKQGHRKVARQVSDACETLGFLIVTGHGVNQTVIDDILNTSRCFFEKPINERIAAIPASPYIFRGYFPSEASRLAATLDVNTPGDLCEVYSMNRFDDRQEAIYSGLTHDREAFFAPNIWPKNIPNFEPAWRNYYAAMEILSNHILTLMASALNLPHEWFVPFCNKHTTNLVANYYPPQIKEPLPNQLRRGAHTDYGSLTVLYQTHASGGLQVQSKSSEWLDVPYINNSFVINIGDLLAMWTNDRWVSTMHRVVNPPHSDANESRQSLAFFHQPNFDARISCIPSCESPNELPKYKVTSAGDWILAKLQKSVEKN